MSNLAIITARGGSKRIPRKNIKDFCGKPIIYYSIKAAVESGIFSEVMVSTDDQEIADYALQCGAKVPFMRSAVTANDYATTAEVLIEVLAEYKMRGREFDIACCIYPTAPFITAEKLKISYKKLLEKQADSILPVVRFSFPPQRAFVIENRKLCYKWPENRNTRSQDLEPFFHDSGQFYMFCVSRFLETKSLIMENTIHHEVSELEVQDIDNIEDWKLAEIKYQILKSKENI
ncbi:pseudaminic acid cytidylyltransferase [Succinispira mobilis]|uniref:pseudaminic acid cytidylyltransferase n=1 Tax=Succinispira mobilis TaxID=78120 RepID=UPI0003752BEE|nr:pseudaminic acid cytidylyltransferase [Succinispira mobilis]